MYTYFYMQLCDVFVAAIAVFLGIWQFGLPDWCMIVMAAMVAFHIIIELFLIIHKNYKILCKCCIRGQYELNVSFFPTTFYRSYTQN